MIRVSAAHVDMLSPVYVPRAARPALSFDGRGIGGSVEEPRDARGREQLAAVLLAQRGDRRAFEWLLREQYDRLYAIARRIVSDSHDAEDATQEAVVRAWRQVPKLRDAQRFEAWITRLLVNACYDILRQRGRRIQVPLDAVRDANPTDHAVDHAERDRLELAFRRLTPQHRAVLVLHFYSDLTAERIAEVVGVPVGTVNSRLHYAVRALRAALEADERGSPAPQEP